MNIVHGKSLRSYCADYKSQKSSVAGRSQALADTSGAFDDTNSSRKFSSSNSRSKFQQNLLEKRRINRGSIGRKYLLSLLMKFAQTKNSITACVVLTSRRKQYCCFQQQLPHLLPIVISPVGNELYALNL